MPKLYREFTTQAAIDAEYNAAQSVPDFAACGREIEEMSQREVQGCHYFA